MRHLRGGVLPEQSRGDLVRRMRSREILRYGGPWGGHGHVFGRPVRSGVGHGLLLVSVRHIRDIGWRVLVDRVRELPSRHLLDHCRRVRVRKLPQLSIGHLLGHPRRLRVFGLLLVPCG